MDIEKKEVNMETKPEDTLNTTSNIEKAVISKKKKNVMGKVNCNHLFLRSEPDIESDAIYIMKKDEPVFIDINGSTDDFYKVTVSCVTGYCVKEFITVQ
jgi:hypothetical protein